MAIAPRISQWLPWSALSVSDHHRKNTLLCSANNKGVKTNVVIHYRDHDNIWHPTDMFEHSLKWNSHQASFDANWWTSTLALTAISFSCESSFLRDCELLISDQILFLCANKCYFWVSPSLIVNGCVWSKVSKKCVSHFLGTTTVRGVFWWEWAHNARNIQWKWDVATNVAHM